jgi:hypothetical protein
MQPCFNTLMQMTSTHVDVFVASGRYSHIGLGVGHVGIFVGIHIAFLLCENPFYIELELGIVGVGDLHPLGGINNYNLVLSLVKGF